MKLYLAIFAALLLGGGQTFGAAGVSPVTSGGGSISVYSNGTLKGTATAVVFSNAARVSVAGSTAIVDVGAASAGGGVSGPVTNAYALSPVGSGLVRVDFAALYPTQTVRVTLTQNSTLWVTNVLDYDLTLEVAQDATGGWLLATNSSLDHFRFSDEVTGLYNDTNATRRTLVKLRGSTGKAIVTGILSNIRP